MKRFAGVHHRTTACILHTTCSRIVTRDAVVHRQRPPETLNYKPVPEIVELPDYREVAASAEPLDGSEQPAGS